MTVVCDVCGKKRARLRRVTRSFGRGKTVVLIENVPVVHCPSCGESYVTPTTLRTIERIRRHRRSLTRGRIVSVAKFA